MNRHLFGGVLAVGLASIIVCTLILSLDVSSSYAQVISDNVFYFTSNTVSGVTSPTTRNYKMDDQIDQPSTPATTATLDISVDAYLCFWTDPEYTQTNAYADVPDEVGESWIVKFYVLDRTAGGTPRGALDITIKITKADGTVVHTTGPINEITDDKLVMYTVTFDYTYFSGWRDDWPSKLGKQIFLSADHPDDTTYTDITNRRILVEFEQTMPEKWTKLEWSGADSGGSSLTTGYVIPENLLGFVFFAPLIPLIAKAVVRRLKREKLLATHEGERRGKR